MLDMVRSQIHDGFDSEWEAQCELVMRANTGINIEQVSVGNIHLQFIDTCVGRDMCSLWMCVWVGVYGVSEVVLYCDRPY